MSRRFGGRQTGETWEVKRENAVDFCVEMSYHAKKVIANQKGYEKRQAENKSREANKMKQHWDEEQRKQFIKEAHSQAVSEKEKILQQIESKIKDIDPVELLSNLSLIGNFIPEDKPEVNRELREEPIINFLCGLFLKEKTWGKKQPRNEEITEIIHLVKEYLIRVIQETMFKHFVNQQSKDREELSFSAVLHRGIKLVNPCVYGFQLEDLIKSIFVQLDQHYLNSVGFSASDALKFGNKIHSRYQRLVNERVETAREATLKAKRQLRDGVEGEKMRDALRRKKVTESGFLESYFGFLSFTLTQRIFVFNSECFCEDGEEEDKQRIENYLAYLSCELGEGNQNYLCPFDDNLINTKPIISLGDGKYFCPLPQNLLDQLPQILEGLLVEDKIRQTKVWQRYQRLKNDYTELRTFEFFSRLVPSESIFRNLEYGKDGEIDVLIKYDNKIFLIEAKSVNFLAREDRLKWDLKKSVGRAYEQSKKARDFIISNEPAFFRDDSRKNVLEISHTRSNFDFFLISVTLENLMIFATDPKRLRAIGLFAENEYPWSVNLQELDLITKHIPSPTILIHYLKRRLDALSEGVFLAYDELSFLGWYLKVGNFYVTADEKGKKPDIIHLADFAEGFDNYYLFHGDAPELNIESDMKKIIGVLETLRPFGYSDVACILLDLPHEAREEFLKKMNQLIQKTEEDRRSHDVTGLYKELDCGITFMTQCGRQSLMRRLVSYCPVKKYQQKVRRWLGMGRDVLDKQWYVNEFLYINEEWKRDEEMDRILKNFPFRK